jgi:hypothetical protein
MDAVRIVCGTAIWLGLLVFPGECVVRVCGIATGWPVIRRWALAIPTSVAVLAVAFYAARSISLALDATLLTVLLVASVAVIGWHRLVHGPEPAFDALEWCALFIIALTVASRLLAVVEQPVPAWADGLHHVLISDLCARTGLLPRSLAPLYPITLDQYHEGAYALSASLTMLAGIKPHLAVSIAMQVLSALGGLGVYLVLDRWSGRAGAVAALLFVGLIASQPAVYVNYARFTQLSANLLFLPAWSALVLALDHTAHRRDRAGPTALGPSLLAGFLLGATLLLHFRGALLVVVFSLPTVIWLLWCARRSGQIQTLTRGAAVFVGAVITAAPVLVPVVRIHVIPRVSYVSHLVTSGTLQPWTAPYPYWHLFSHSVWPGMTTMLVAMAAGAGVALWRRNRLAALLTAGVGGVALFYVIESLHPMLDTVNPGFAFLMAYIPAGLGVGLAVNIVPDDFLRRSTAVSCALAVVAMAALPRTTRVLEPFRFFVTPADRRALTWIKDHTPASAVFAVNTTFWVPGIAHGTDAGYWIPYFAERQTTTGCLLPGRFAYYAALSALVVDLQNGRNCVPDLARRGVTYLYIGARGNYAEPGLRRSALLANPNLRLVYDDHGVSIFAIEATASTDHDPHERGST